MDKEFWKGKRVFITGDTGFKGTWLKLWLEKLGAKLEGYSLPDDILNPLNLSIRLDGFRPDIVVHFAAQTLVRKGYEIPSETFEVNIQGTVNLLEAVRKCPNIKYALVATTDKVFQANDPYSTSKTCQELVVQSYRSSFDLPICTARAGNCIGGGDWNTDRLIPDCVRAVMRKQIIPVRNPLHKRPWIHVLDALRGYLTMVEDKNQSTGIFIPCQETVERVVNGFCTRWGEGVGWRKDDYGGPHEESQIAASSLWASKWDLDTALDKTVEWYKADIEGKDMRKFSLRQIEEYENG